MITRLSLTGRGYFMKRKYTETVKVRNTPIRKVMTVVAVIFGK